MAAIVLARLKVPDYDKWRPVFESYAELRKSHGCTGTHIFRNAHEPTEPIINMQWDSEENARRFFSGDELRAAMQEAGMSAPPDVTFLEDAGRTAS